MILRSHRLRIGLAAFGSALVVIGLAFGGMAWYARHASVQAGIDTLRPLAEDIAKGYDGPSSLKEMKEGIPNNVSIAIYDDGRQLFTAGRVNLPAKTGTEEREFNGEKWITARFDRGNLAFLVARDWRGEEHSQQVFLLTLAVSWIPLAGFVGFAAFAAAAGMFRSVEGLTRQAAALSASARGAQLAGGDDSEFRSLSTELNAMLERIWQEVGRRDRLVADIAHDLRTPLTIVRGRLETLLLKHYLDESSVRSIRIAVEETERLSGLVDLILDSGQRPDTVTEPIDLAPIVKETQVRWEHQLPMLRITADSAHVIISPAELNRILDNLLDNARRFTPANSKVEINLRSERQWAKLSVTDEGPGVPNEDQKSIFERFVRLEESRNRETGGFGLGLAVCKEIVEARGGSLAVRNIPQGGAEFLVTLPLAKL